MGINAPVLLTNEHELAYFDCGNMELKTWLKKQAVKSQKRGMAKVYVVTIENSLRVIGFYAIAMGSVQREHAYSAIKRNAPNPIPMVVLARLGVDREHHGKGLGAGLLKDCVLRSVHAMNVVGGAGLLVHAIDESAQRFYRKFGFKTSPFDPLILMARICDINPII
ncbi:GNAT family N-acetyltransferase [Vibrio mediterranei]|uniref:GNAT family N-acetyltransferase n=1 Tax=Vibrio mediterranei TaxID=689 RepID=A0ABX5D4F4_9VIBR|nr:GNAT family N-acetyltransferase [Vibrio mediterranei]PCD85310.1 GNAT family N-acetyltransferase [Vibrio mediterranei]PRQ64543.1 GNAT family N-acetyltransferase [Vibrio mediterranei]